MCEYEKSRVVRVIIFENANETTWGHPREKPRGPIAHIIIMYIVTRLCGLFFKRINTMRPRAYRYVPFTYYFPENIFTLPNERVSGAFYVIIVMSTPTPHNAPFTFQLFFFFWTVSHTSGYIVTLHARTGEKRSLWAHLPSPGGDHLSAGTKRVVQFGKQQVRREQLTSIDFVAGSNRKPRTERTYNFSCQIWCWNTNIS